MNEFFRRQEFTAKTQPVTKWKATLEQKPPKHRLASFLRKVKFKND